MDCKIDYFHIFTLCLSMVNIFIQIKPQLLCILTSFWVLRAPKSWAKHCFQPFFNLFYYFKVPPQGVDQILHVNQLLHVYQL